MKQEIRTKQDALDTLDEIKASLEKDINFAIRKYMDYYDDTKHGVGLYAISRLIFPEIDNLGSYLAGTTEKSAKNAILFMKQYFSIVNPEYNSKSAFIYIVYRHGLMHQHTPKLISYKGKVVGWRIDLTEPGQSSSHLRRDGDSIIIDGRQLLEDMLRAIEKYKNDITKNDPNLLQNFKNAHEKMMSVMNEDQFLEKSGVESTDLDFLK